MAIYVGKGLVRVYRERLGEEVSQVLGAGYILDLKLVLADAAPGPIEAHVYGLTALRANCFCGQAYSALIIT